MLYYYIQDLIQGVLRAAIVPEARNEVFNITYGGGRTLKELADLILLEFPGIKLKYNLRDSLMPERGTLSIEKARRILGYEPKFPIETGFVNYIDWYRKFRQTQPHFLK